jgi:AraC-like DNA-binding protein
LTDAAPVLPVRAELRRDARQVWDTRRMELAISHVLYKEKAADYRLRADAHPTYEICYVDRGVVEVVTAGARLALGQGELCLFLPHQEHGLWASGEPPGPNLVTVDFTTGFRELRVLARRKLRLDAPQRGLLQTLLRERQGAGAYRDEMERAVLATLLVSLLRDARAPANDGGRDTAAGTARGRSLLVDEAVDYIRVHLAEPLSVASIADAVHVSPSHLSHSFAGTRGAGVMQVVREARVDHAKKLLRTAPLTVAEVAHASGFASVHHFSRVFKQATGFTPAAYGRSLR